jgi:hypothetical protein
MDYQLDISATEDEKYDFVTSVANGAMKYPEIIKWIAEKTINNWR